MIPKYAKIIEDNRETYPRCITVSYKNKVYSVNEWGYDIKCFINGYKVKEYSFVDFNVGVGWMISCLIQDRKRRLKRVFKKKKA